MKRFKLKMLLLSLLLILFFSNTISGEMTMSEYLSLYDFNNTEQEPEFEWKGFTDQVMGGVSEISTKLMSEENERFIRMEGDVSLKNNGGFIQIQLLLASGFNTFNASDYDGIRLHARGKDSGYYLFIRTSNTWFPWQFFKAPLEAGQDWQTLDIPWSEIIKGDYGSCGKFNPAQLKSIAVVAYGKEFRAEIDIKRIGLYKN